MRRLILFLLPFLLAACSLIGWRPEKYAGSYKAIVNVVKSQIKGFEVVEQFL